MSRRTIQSASLGALLLLAGCALGPNYERPQTLASGEYRQPAPVADAATSTTATPAMAVVDAGTTQTSGTLLGQLPWWQLFGDPQLQELIRVALANNHDLLIATARIDQSRALLGIASADLFPQISASGDASRTRTPDSMRTLGPTGTFLGAATPGAPDGLGGTVATPGVVPVPQVGLSPARSNQYAAGLDLSYELDLWGRVRRTRQAARAELLASEETRRAVVSRLVTDVARNYFSLLELDREVQITSATLATRRETLALMELRRKYETASDLEVNQFRAEVSASLAQLATLESQREQLENALGVLTGQAPGAIKRGLPLDQQPALPLLPAGVPSDLLEQRPDLRAAEQQLAAATARIGAAKAAFFPRIALTGNAGYRSTELSNLLESNSAGWMIAGNVTQPIFEGGRNWFNLKATRAQREEVLQNYRKTVLEALREVDDALVSRQQSHEERRHRFDQAGALGESVRLSDMRYRAGYSSYLELLDAQRQLFAAQLDFERARLEEYLSAIRLYKALGGGWTNLP